MVLQCCCCWWSSCAPNPKPNPLSYQSAALRCQTDNNNSGIRNSSSRSSTYCSFNFNFNFKLKNKNNKQRLDGVKLGIEQVAAEIAHNKVLVAAGVSAAIGQLSKPFTASLLYGNKHFNFMAAFQAGGFPSTHSSTVVAAATSLALERGFSDSIFGLTVVYAALVMYDAQGVRREVGKHAKVLNRGLPNTQQGKSITPSSYDYDYEDGDADDTNDCQHREDQEEEGNNFVPYSANAYLLLLKPDKKVEKTATGTKQMMLGSSSNLAAVDGGGGGGVGSQLKESIGHSEVEVIAGAIVGFLVSVALYTIT